MCRVVQAQCRGYVMRQGLSLVQTQFEDVVREIDGGLDHLQWRGNIIPKPHFTDTVSFSVITHFSHCLLLFKNNISCAIKFRYYFDFQIFLFV